MSTPFSNKYGYSELRHRYSKTCMMCDKYDETGVSNIIDMKTNQKYPICEDCNSSSFGSLFFVSFLVVLLIVFSFLYFLNE